jgi:hypothetical protein
MMDSQNNTTDQERQREIGLLWMSARILVQIDAKLADFLILQQQSVDLLRRIVSEERKP